MLHPKSLLDFKIPTEINNLNQQHSILSSFYYLLLLLECIYWPNLGLVKGFHEAVNTSIMQQKF